MRFRFALQPLLERRLLTEREERASLARACRASLLMRQATEHRESVASASTSVRALELIWSGEARRLAGRRLAAHRLHEERARSAWERAALELRRIERMRERARDAFLVAEERREERELEEARRSPGGRSWTR